MISISIFRINAKNWTIWYNLIQTSVPLVYTNYFYNIYCPNMGGSRGGDKGPPWNCQIICFCHVEIFRQTPSGNLDPPPPLGKFSGSAHAKHDLSESFFQNNYFPCYKHFLKFIFSTGNSWIFFYFNTGFHSIYVTTF